MDVRIALTGGQPEDHHLSVGAAAGVAAGGGDGERGACALRGDRRFAAARSFGSEPVSVAAVRAWTRAELVAQHADPATVEVAQLLISEVATNAIVHTLGRSIIVRWSADGTLQAEVHDQDVDHQPRRGHPGPDDTSGRGLALVEALASGWGTWTATCGKCVWFHLPA